MDKIRIQGGKQLRGEVEVSGAKNAALPVLISSILTDGACEYSRVPDLQDIRTTLKLLSQMGVTAPGKPVTSNATIQATKLDSHEAPYDLVRTMRASVVVLGPLLARLGKARVSLPGGCAIGARPINYHLFGFEKLGAAISLEGGYVEATAPKGGLRGNRVRLEFPSVGATENVMMAATLAKGESVLENCAREPEIVNLAEALRAMGAELEGEGTDTIRIQGKDQLHGAKIEIIGDRIEAGTFLAAAFATQGQVTVRGLAPAHLESVLSKFEEAGAHIERGTKSISLESKGRARATNVTTLPFPGFPTDMQAQFMALMCVADGASVITETIFENRFMHVPELMRLGADITIRGNAAMIKGRSDLKGAPIMATDLRASASLIMGGLCAEGETVVSRVYHLDRGYERMEEKLGKLGATIERIT